jgi:hypothetical protein
MLTVILSEIVAVSIDAACWMPARKLAGAAMAAASNKRLMVIPHVTMEKLEVGPRPGLRPPRPSGRSSGSRQDCPSRMHARQRSPANAGAAPPTEVEGGRELEASVQFGSIHLETEVKAILCLSTERGLHRQSLVRISASNQPSISVRMTLPSPQVSKAVAVIAAPSQSTQPEVGTDTMPSPY